MFAVSGAAPWHAGRSHQSPPCDTAHGLKGGDEGWSVAENVAQQWLHLDIWQRYSVWQGCQGEGVG